MNDPFNLYQNIHFIGIGGIGISALARLLKNLGHHVTGSDQTRSHNADLLISEGFPIAFGHTAKNLPEKCDLVIHTTAIPADNDELLAASHLQIPLLTYPQAVGKFTEKQSTISICGTHGKTTITAMLGYVISELGSDPTVIVGSLVSQFNNSNLRLGSSDILVLESCEYQEAFLNYWPKTIILNNIDPEHLDYFRNESNYLNAFRKFITKLSPEGTLIANIDDSNIMRLLSEQNWPFRIVTYGRSSSADFSLNNNTIRLPSGEVLTLNLSIPGDHNLLNSTSIIAATSLYQLNAQDVADKLTDFKGAARRLEYKGQMNGIPVYDDYGHAPAEIKATLAALKSKFGNNTRILCVFQPHQYSRTFLFLNDFAESFYDASLVYIPNIYKSRDTAEDIAKINVDMLVEAINSKHAFRAHNTHDFSETQNKIVNNAANFDLILTIGAGDITRLSDLLVSGKTQ